MKRCPYAPPAVYYGKCHPQGGPTQQLNSKMRSVLLIAALVLPIHGAQSAEIKVIAANALNDGHAELVAARQLSS
jgi:hypothetical protein